MLLLCRRLILSQDPESVYFFEGNGDSWENEVNEYFFEGSASKLKLADVLDKISSASGEKKKKLSSTHRRQKNKKEEEGSYLLR